MQVEILHAREVLLNPGSTRLRKVLLKVLLNQKQDISKTTMDARSDQLIPSLAAASAVSAASVGQMAASDPPSLPCFCQSASFAPHSVTEPVEV